MSAYYRNKNKREPLIKIGSKYENIEYSSKNIDPNLNHLNRQLYAEESLSKARKQRQLEEYSYYAKALENTKPPVDPYANRLNNNILTGKIGQEQKEVDYQRYQQSKSKVESKAFARVPSSTQRRDMRDMNYHGYNIINNNILGFCDPMQKFPTSSYKQTYQGKGLQKEISEMTPSQYEDYQKFRKEQLEIMEQQKRLQQRGQMQQEKDMERTQVDVNAEMEEKKRVMEKKLQMEREYMEKKRQLEMEQRQMDQMQRNYQGQNTYAQAQAQAQGQVQGQVQGNAGYEYDEGMQRQYEQQQQRVIGGEAEQVNGAMQGGLTEEQMKECQREYEKYLKQQQREGKVGEQQVRDSERDVQQQQQQQGVMERQPQFEGTGSNVNDNQPQVNMNALSEQERAKIEEENYRKAYEAYLLEQERAYQQQQQQQQLQQQPPLKDNPNLDRPIPQEYPQQHQQQLPPQQEQQPLQEPSNRISDEEYMRYIEYMNQKEAEERYMKQQQLQQQQQQQQQQPHPQYDENEQYQHYLRNNPYQPQPQHPPQSDPQQDLEYLQRLKQYEDIVQDNQPQPQPPQQQQQSLPPQTYSPYAPIAVTPSRAQMNYHNARQKAMQGTVATPGKVTKQNFIHGNPYSTKNYNIGSSALESNPITHPVNSYKFDYNRLNNPLVAPSNRLASIGNNIIHK